MKQLSAEEFYSRMAARCSQREYCRSDVLRKAQEAGLSREDARSLANRLEAEGFIDENRYARAFAHDKTLYDHWGRLKTRQALAMRGISNSDIAEALAAIDEDEYSEIVRATMEAKARTLHADSPYALRQKLLRFAASRGFELNIVQQQTNISYGED